MSPINPNSPKILNDSIKANVTESTNDIKSPVNRKSVSIGKNIFTKIGNFFNKLSTNSQDLIKNIKAKIITEESKATNKSVKIFQENHPSKIKKPPSFDSHQESFLQQKIMRETLKTESIEKAKKNRIVRECSKEFIDTEKTCQKHLSNSIKVLTFMEKNKIGSYSSKEFKKIKNDLREAEKLSEKFLEPVKENSGSELLSNLLNEDFFKYQEGLKKCLLNQPISKIYEKEFMQFAQENKDNIEYKNLNKEMKFSMNSFDTMLIAPVQRLPRHELLLKVLIKTSPEDKQIYQPSLENTQKITQEANQVVRGINFKIRQMIAELYSKFS